MTLSLNNLTFIIVTFKSEHIIHECIESLPKNSEIILIDNSNNNDMKNDLEKKYNKIRVIVQKNEGMGSANNKGIKLCKTDYAFVINPDVKTKPKTTTTTVNQVKTQTQKPLKGFKQFRTDSITRKGVKNVAKGFAGKATKVLGVAGLALDAGQTFRDTYKRSQAQGHSKQRSIGKSLAKIGGGIVGGALGGTVGSVAGPGGSFVGAGLGYAGGKELGGRAFDKLTTQQGRDELKQSFKNFRKRAMKPVGT